MYVYIYHVVHIYIYIHVSNSCLVKSPFFRTSSEFFGTPQFGIVQEVPEIGDLDINSG